MKKILLLFIFLLILSFSGKSQSWYQPMYGNYDIYQSLRIRDSLGVGVTYPNNIFQVYELIQFDPIQYSTHLGFQAGQANTGSECLFLGGLAGKGNTGHYNTFVGTKAGNRNTSGTENVYVGNEAGYYQLDGDFNTVVGYRAGYGLAGQLSANNTLVGYKAGFSQGDKNAANNTFVGYMSGYNNNSFGNVFLGKTAGYNETGSNKLYIDNSTTATPLIYGDFANDSIVLNANVTFRDTFKFNDNYIFVNDSTNTKIGYLAGHNIDTSVTYYGGAYVGEYLQNTAVGARALMSNRFGRDNTAIGYMALAKDTDSWNTAIGRETMSNLITGHHNCAVGGHAMFKSNGAYYNTALGVNAMYYNTNGSYNTAVGQDAMRNITNGTNNTSVGNNTLYENTTSDYNCAFGHAALSSKVSGVGQNAVFGGNSMMEATGDYNTVVGVTAFRNIVAGNNNVALGWQAGNSHTSGSNNTYIGYSSGHSNLTGQNNVFLGYNSGYNETGSNKLYIDNSNTSSPLIHGDFATDELTINGGLTVTNTTEDLTPDTILTKQSDGSIGATATIYLDSITGNIANSTTGLDTIFVDGAIVNNGASFNNITTVNAATYDLLATDYILSITYTSTAAVTSLTLPTAQVIEGRTIVIKDAGLLAGTNNITIDTEGAALIDGAATAVLSTNKISINLYCDGTNWFIY